MLALTQIRIKQVKLNIDKIKTKIFNLRQISNWRTAFHKRIGRLATELTRWEGLLDKLVMLTEYNFHVNGYDSIVHNIPRQTIYRFGVNVDYQAVTCACPSHTYQKGTVDGQCKHIRTFNSLMHGNLLDIIYAKGNVLSTYKASNPSQSLKKEAYNSNLVQDDTEAEYQLHLELKASLGLW